MSKIIVPVLFSSAIIFCGYLMPADPATAATHPSVCFAQEKACLDTVKDSPNEIDREVCTQAKDECLAKCQEESRAEEEQRQQEQASKDQEEKARLDYEGLTPEAQLHLKLKRAQEEHERNDREADEKMEREEQERQQKAEEAREQAKKAREQQGSENSFGNSLPIYQFK